MEIIPESQVSRLYLVFNATGEGFYIVAESMEHVVVKWKSIAATEDEPRKIELVADEVIL